MLDNMKNICFDLSAAHNGHTRLPDGLIPQSWSTMVRSSISALWGMVQSDVVNPRTSPTNASWSTGAGGFFLHLNIPQKDGDDGGYDRAHISNQAASISCVESKGIMLWDSWRWSKEVMKIPVLQCTTQTIHSTSRFIRICVYMYV